MEIEFTYKLKTTPMGLKPGDCFTLEDGDEDIYMVITYHDSLYYLNLSSCEKEIHDESFIPHDCSVIKHYCILTVQL